MRHLKSQPLIPFDKFGELLAALRKAKAHPQEAVAKALKVNRKTIERWEHDKASPGDENLNDIAQYFGVAYMPLLILRSGRKIYFHPQTRRYSFSNAKELKPRIDLDPPDGQKFVPITEKNVADIVLEYDHCIYATDKPLQDDLITEAARLFPRGCVIGRDGWGHYNAHIICLPLRHDAYLKIRNRKLVEGELKPQDLCRPQLPEFSCFYFYSFYACCEDVGSAVIRHACRFVKKWAREDDILAGYAVTQDGNALAKRLGMKLVFEDLEECKLFHTEDVPTLWESSPQALAEAWTTTPERP